MKMAWNILGSHILTSKIKTGIRILRLIKLNMGNNVKTRLGY